MSRESIIDASKPSAGRIYDYLLGGHHNFEVDRQAAERLKTILPYLPKVMRLQRWCLQDLAVELTEKRGFDTIIDFASGLPTNDHIHEAVPEGTTVIYSDYDPVVVEYANDILKDIPNVFFFEADARQPKELLNRPKVQAILNERRNVAVIYWGISLFLTDNELLDIARSLYEWTGESSCWAFNAQVADSNPNDPASIQASKIYEQMGSPVHLRPLKEYLRLIQPWQPDEKNFVSLLEWHGFDQAELSESDRQSLGPGSGGHGAYLVKR